MTVLDKLFASGSGAIKYSKGKFVITFKDKSTLKFIGLLTKRNPNISVTGTKLTLKITNDIDADDLLEFFKQAGIIS